MAESLLIQTELVNSSASPSDPSSGSALFQRRVEFHPARKTFKGFDNGGDTDFKLETLNPCTSSDARRAGSGASAPGGGKNDGAEFSEYGLDPELCFGMTFRRICLTYTEPLAAYLQSGKHKSSCQIAGFCALCAIQNHVSRALQSSGRILSPETLVVNLRCYDAKQTSICCLKVGMIFLLESGISRNFRNARQEDAHEYMVNLLESMHRCCLPSGVPSESPSAYEKSLVHKIFGGRLQSQVKCQQCSSCSNKFDPFIDLSLEIFKADSLHKALVNFTAAEWLDGGEKQYQCQRCKQKVRALKQLTIHKAPYVLAIHLKRFHAFDPGQKIKKKVQFGCSLDLKPFVSGSYEGDLKYSLYGVLVHSGHNTHSGHYYCYVRTSNNMWYTLDDNRVSHVSEREVLDQQAYMLFYVRDIKSLVPRKPVDILKENMKADVNANGIRASSTLNRGLDELVQNGPAETRFSGAFSTTAEAPKNSSNVDSLKVSLLKDVSVQQGNSLIVAESFMQDGDHVSRCVENGISKEDKDSTSMASTVNDSQKPDAKLVTNETSQNNNVVTVNTLTPADVSTKPLNSTDPITSILQESNKSSQVGASATDSVCEKASGEVDEKAVRDQGLLDKSVNKSLDMDGSKSNCLKKSKKRLKYHISSMHLGSNFFYMASLGLKKKKHKRSKCQTNMRNLNKEKLDKHTSSVVRTSSSFECGATGSVHKKDANRMKPLNLNGESRMESQSVADGEFRKRIHQNSSVLATSDQVGNIHGVGSLVSQYEVRHAGNLLDGKRDKTHNGLMGMVTRDLEETVVARWDDIELPPSQSMESKNDKIARIGYIGDEWDEEYDRGKRKKLKRFKHSFDGPNPFQEIATKKSHSKKAKVYHSSSGSPPFRI
ncbi:ubiquitin carboxyl-terminal hydrolase 23 [Senna tora]|uniref:Ubiquitin carboxyl-terminal hydrolase 23 n=1 Tax=Senna tora TaxID=362788 RepID=A0A834W743_9FABA|nr:ubiquitin carboxyl-terminal hydrolase 23 [Senna tora]